MRVDAQTKHYSVGDTILRLVDSSRYEIYNLRAYSDTVVVVTVVPVGFELPYTVFLSTNRGVDFEVTTVPSRPVVRHEPIVGTDLMGNKHTEGLGTIIWHKRNGGAITYDTVYKAPGDSIVTSLDRLQFHPTRRGMTVIICEPPPYDPKRQQMYVKFQDDEAWLKMAHPDSTCVDSARKRCNLNVHFDYSRPERMYVSTQLSENFSGADYTHYYHTDDYGRSYKRLLDQSAALFVGHWRSDWGLFYGNDNPARILRHFLKNVITGEREDLGFRESIMIQLLPGYDVDTAHVSLTWLHTSGFGGDLTGLATHPETPSTFVTDVSIDTVIGATTVQLVGTAVTTDWGQSWAWMCPPVIRHGGHYRHVIALDPKSGDVYMTYYVPTTLGNVFKERGVVRYSLAKPSSVLNDIKANSILFPNPTTGRCSIAMNKHHRFKYRTVINSMGEEVLSKSWIGINAVSIDTDLSSVANGLYYIVLVGDEQSTMFPVFVQQ